MRPLPGRARLYPETDVPPIELTPDILRKIERTKGETLAEKQAKLRKMLGESMAMQMLKSPRLQLFEKLVDCGIDPTLAASTLENTLVSLRRDGVEPNEEQIRVALEGWKSGKLVKAAIPELLRAMASGSSAENAVKEKNLERITGKELELLAAENGYDFGRIISGYRLRVDPAELQDLLAKTNKTLTKANKK